MNVPHFVRRTVRATPRRTQSHPTAIVRNTPLLKNQQLFSVQLWAAPASRTCSELRRKGTVSFFSADETAKIYSLLLQTFVFAPPPQTQSAPSLSFGIRWASTLLVPEPGREGEDPTQVSPHRPTDPVSASEASQVRLDLRNSFIGKGQSAREEKASGNKELRAPSTERGKRKNQKFEPFHPCEKASTAAPEHERDFETEKVCDLLRIEEAVGKRVQAREKKKIAAALETQLKSTSYPPTHSHGGPPNSPPPVYTGPDITATPYGEDNVVSTLNAAKRATAAARQLLIAENVTRSRSNKKCDIPCPDRQPHAQAKLEKRVKTGIEGWPGFAWSRRGGYLPEAPGLTGCLPEASGNPAAAEAEAAAAAATTERASSTTVAEAELKAVHAAQEATKAADAAYAAAHAMMEGKYSYPKQSHHPKESPKEHTTIASRRPPAAGPSPELIRRKLEQVMNNKENFRRSATASFRQFDTTGSGCLRLSDVQALVRRLCSNLQLPPVNETALKEIFTAFDLSGSGYLELEDFFRMYWEILCRIREKYYPEKTMRIRRSGFVGRRNLENSGMSITDLFTFVEKLGSGSFGDVHQVIEKASGLERVMKTINKKRSQVPLEQIEAEIEVLKSLDHPNIIKIFEVYDDHHNVYILMETCKGGELLQRLVDAQTHGAALTEKSVSEIMRQLMNALAYFHSKHVAHKDLKPENILFQDKSPDSPIKVIDFGLAELFEKNDAHSKNAAGTALYMAPEVFMRHLSLKCDIWSAGVVMYFLLTGCLPFKGNSIDEVQHEVCHCEPDYARECAHLTPEAISLLMWMLVKPEQERPMATEVLKHPWFRQANMAVIKISPIICENMKKYMRQSHLKNALVNMLVHQLNVTGPQIRQINEIFRQLDKNNDGTISHSELTEGLAQVGLPQWDINRIIQSIDVDDSGNVSYTEFLAACYSWQESELNIIWAAFQKLDKDGDGKISVPEFESVVGGEDYRLVPKETVKALVAQIDKNGDGQIDWDEFLEYLKLS